MTTATVKCLCPKPGTGNEEDCGVLHEPDRVYHANEQCWCGCCCHWGAEEWEERAKWEPPLKPADEGPHRA